LKFKITSQLHTEYALIVAGGRGTRIKTPVPKQFIEINGKPVLLHTIDVFLKYSESVKIILVLPEDDLAHWHRIAKEYNFNKNISLQTGGATRFQSVKRGLEKIDGDGLVAIHDGVRPLVTPDIIRESFLLAKEYSSAVASVALKESIRSVSTERTKAGSELSNALDRATFRLIQTPQTFQVNLIKKAYEIAEDDRLTDDASVAERAGHSIKLFEGSYSNIKITTREDLVIAEALLKAAEREKSN
jgi:2-C-methyl-D-erythritol 4-phosphate cytidylyltransferase